MTLADRQVGMDLCEQAGWNQTLEDWAFFLTQAQNQAHLALWAHKPVGTVVGLDLGEGYSWISMMLVDQAFRRKGIGKALMQTVLGSGATAFGLDATPAGASLYVPMGFAPVQTLYRLTGTLPSAKRIPSKVKALSRADWAELLRLDAIASGLNRAYMLNHLFTRYPEYAFGYFEGPKLTGYCLGRKGKHYDQVGPIIAPDQNVARALWEAVSLGWGEKPCVVDVFAHQEGFLALLESWGFVLQRTLLRMKKGSWPEEGVPAYQYAIAGPELT